MLREIRGVLPFKTVPMERLRRVRRGMGLQECVELLKTRPIHLFTVSRDGREYLLAKFYAENERRGEEDELGVSALALFEDRTFLRFVEAPQAKRETVDVNGTPMTRGVPFPVGEEVWIDACLSPSAATSIYSIDRAAFLDGQARYAENPAQGALAMRALVSAPFYMARIAEAYKENLRHWNAYDPCALQPGMARVDVERMLGEPMARVPSQDPLQLFVYGPRALPDVNPFYQFERLGVLYRDGKIQSVYRSTIFSSDWMARAEAP